MPPSLTRKAEEGVTFPDLTRLPRSVIPKRYELKLDVYPEKKKFSGLVNIRLYFNSVSTRIIWLHSVNLDIKRACIRFSQFALPLEAEAVIRNTAKCCIGIKFSQPIQVGERAWLTLEYSGKLSPNLEGFFTTTYVNKNGEKKIGAATMFAATEARTCFPCFDEPDFKAIFALEVTVADNLTVISNMPVMDSRFKNVYLTDGSSERRRTDYFEWTKEMSTYLVCVVIGEYEYLEVKAAERTVIRIYTPWGQREQGRFALEVSKKSLEFFNDYFGKKYPLPKLDFVALSRLSVAAMENWGVVTCRETGLITDKLEANPLTLQNIATLIAHEISHQWFGNLVTMKWWDGLYLNEGFATLMQYLCIDHLFPKFEVFDRFCIDTVIPALGLDSLNHTHPIEMALEDPAEISQVFDKITYCKGASVMFMIHEFIGEKAFRDAIQRYMDHFSYNNATTEDLWTFLSRSSNQDVGTIMNSWIRELGFPIVKASFIEETNVLSLQQERFSNIAHGNQHMIWNIPLKGIYLDQSGKLHKFDILFDKDEHEIELINFDIHTPQCWVKLNPRMTGFYRVHYGERLFNNLLNNLDSDYLTPIDRMGLFDNQVAMVLSEDGSTVRILKIIQLFKDFEKNSSVWKSVCGILHQIRSLTWPSEELANLFDQFCLNIIRPVVSSIGYVPKKDESDNDAMLRSTLFTFLATLGDSHTITMAREMFKNHLEGISEVPPSLRDAIFRAVMVKGNQQTLKEMLMLYRTMELAEEKRSVLEALGCAHDPNLITEALEFSLCSEVQYQEALSVVISASINRYGYKLTWSFFELNLDKFLERYLGALFLFPKLVQSVVKNICDHDGYNEVSHFFSENRSKFFGNEKSVEQAEEHIKLNVIWRDRHIESIQNFLDGYFKS